MRDVGAFYYICCDMRGISKRRGLLKDLKGPCLPSNPTPYPPFPSKDNKSDLFLVDSFQGKVLKSTSLHISVLDPASPYTVEVSACVDGGGGCVCCLGSQCSFTPADG